MIEHEQIPPKLKGDVAVKIEDAANYFKHISSNAVMTPFGYMQLSTSILGGVGYQLGRLARFVCKDALMYRTFYIRGYEYTDFERNSEQEEREEFLRSKYNPGTALLSSLLPLLKEAGIDPQEFALSGNIFAEGMTNSVELGRIMHA